MNTADEIISLLQLQPLPHEGGFYVETYRSEATISQESLRPSYLGTRHFATGIYYLLTPETFSAIHLLPGDEMFHFYLGDPVEMLQLRENGTGTTVIIGNDLQSGMRPQVVVPARVWQGARLQPGGSFALLGTTMSPGFEFADYMPGVREDLLRKYPGYADQICALTRD